MGLVLMWVAGCTNVPTPTSLAADACPYTATSRDVGSDGEHDTGDAADAGSDRCPQVTRLFPTTERPPVPFDTCLYASPVAYEGSNGLEIIALSGDEIVGFAPRTGEAIWRFEVPAPAGEAGVMVATPAVVGALLIVEYHTLPDADTTRERHNVLALDLETHQMADGFDLVTIDGSFPGNDGETIEFRPSNALGRGHLRHAKLPGDVLGKVYATYGNARDIQPWHGFAFEIDLDAWSQSGADAAITGSMLTTPELDCGPAGVSGSRDRRCGGGLWAPSGPLVVERDGSYELILGTGNGQLDVPRGDFANSVLKVGPGLQFEPGCDATACAGFDPDGDYSACVATCGNALVLRDDVGDRFPVPESGVCDGAGMLECWGKLDYVGGSTPAHVVLDSGTEVLAYPTKDGSVYLFDAQHLGTLYDRAQLVPVCGTRDDACIWDWAGMIVTQPEVSRIDGRPAILVPTFMPDHTHPAGVVALAVDDSSGTPKLERLWTAPDFDTAPAIERFRQHPSRITLQRVRDDLEIAWLVETFRTGHGRLIAIDVADGTIVVDREIAGPGMRFTKPLIVGDVIYLNNCDEGAGPAYLEAYEIAYGE